MHFVRHWWFLSSFHGTDVWSDFEESQEAILWPQGMK